MVDSPELEASSNGAETPGLDMCEGIRDAGSGNPPAAPLTPPG
eukprot:CAMPEP_0198690416 /NCGR_PEP_ID=MMETSP1468-20131203/174183_1 /TAXON_ID=1461545 /ORGANISM="Mantoniella sp, Strain CCMP1436" /LENGTH=42 /DNA_ID= /DNA_START= /DNA_END= /DNA_ORIENTATION=